MDSDLYLQKSISALARELSLDLQANPEHSYQIELSNGVIISLDGDSEQLTWNFIASFPTHLKKPPAALFKFFLGSNALLFINQSCKFVWDDDEQAIKLCKILHENKAKDPLLIKELQRFQKVSEHWSDILSAFDKRKGEEKV